LGKTHWDFAEELKPYLTGQKSPSFLFNDFFGKKLNLRTFNSIKDQESGVKICAPESNIKSSDGKKIVYIRDATFFYNRDKEVDETYSATEIAKELHLVEPLELSNQITDSIELEILAPFNSKGYINAVEYADWDHSAHEQRIIALRKKFVNEVEYNSVSMIFATIYIDIELGDRVSVDVNKPTAYHNAILSNDYIVKDLLISYDSENEDNTFTKFVGIPIIDLD